MGIGSELVNVEIGQLIYKVASAIARSAIELDRASIEVAEMMGGLKTITDEEGKVRFEDSRVFFGHEYMTIAEAMVTQGDANPAIAPLIAQQTISYRAYTPPTNPDSADPATITTAADIAPVALTGASLAAYQATTKSIRDRIGYLEMKRAEKLAENPPASVVAINQNLNDLRALDTHNSNKVANIFTHQVQVPTRLSLLELGFAPVFYSFVDTIIEFRMAFTVVQENSTTISTTDDNKTRSASLGFRFTPFGRGRANYGSSVTTSQVNATYSNRYSYTAEGSSLVRTKLTPLPAPAILEERIRAIMAADQARKAAELGLLTAAAGTA